MKPTLLPGDKRLSPCFIGQWHGSSTTLGKHCFVYGWETHDFVNPANDCEYSDVLVIDKTKLRMYMNFGPGKKAKFQEKPGFFSLQVYLEGTCTCIFALTVSNPDPGVQITIGNDCRQGFADAPQCWVQEPLSVKFGSSQCTMAVCAPEFDKKGGSATGFYLMIEGRKAWFSDELTDETRSFHSIGSEEGRDGPHQGTHNSVVDATLRAALNNPALQTVLQGAMSVCPIQWEYRSASSYQTSSYQTSSYQASSYQASSYQASSYQASSYQASNMILDILSYLWQYPFQRPA